MANNSQLSVESYLSRLRENLQKTVLDFWYPRGVDEVHGGFLTSYDADGDFAGNDRKMIVTQARMLWFSARLAREGYGDRYHEAAKQGFEFLTDEMRDEESGGYYWEVERDGTVTKPNKHMYGQSFVLYALSEYYRATNDETARQYASDLFSVFEREAYDTEHGGYVEYFESDWTPITSGGTYLDNIEPDWSPKEDVDAKLDPSTKLMNTHLHLMEAVTTFYRATGDEGARKRLDELLTINTNTVVRKQLGACTDKYTADWQPRIEQEDHRIVSYGHDVENVWLTMEAATALDKQLTYYRDLYDTLWEYTLEYGYDEAEGGLYFYGPFDRQATSRIKAWWVQAEAMTSALRMFEFTGDQTYARIFEEIYEFIETHHVDEAVGEWHSGVTTDLEPVGRKGAMYKGAYHNGRALLECINTLERMRDR